MEERLRIHDDERGTDGWRAESTDWLMGRLVEEGRELERVMADEKADYRDVIAECADVANFAMMVADKMKGR